MDNRNVQRWATVTAGALLAAVGIRKGGGEGILLSLTGGALGLIGYLKLGPDPSLIAEPRHLHWRPPSDRLMEDARSFQRSAHGSTDAVHEASDESFPASDPPSFTPNTSLGGHEK